jgi:hypothetical protein
MMKKYCEIQQAVAIILVFTLLISTNGCYSTKNISKNEIPSTNKKYVIIHTDSLQVKLKDIKTKSGILMGMRDYEVHPEVKKQTIHIYTTAQSINIKGDTVRVPYENIAKVEVSEINGGKTFLIVAGSIGFTFILVGLIAVLSKGASCPFIYADSGDDYKLEGEIYSGATALPLERDDYLPVKNIKPVDQEYRLRITNEVEEIQMTNLTELVTVDHKPGEKILMDKYGNAYQASLPETPATATDAYGMSILKELSYSDSLRYVSTVKNDNNLKDTISLTFNRPAGATEAKLVIKGKNTMWLDFMFGRFSDLFGNRLEQWKDKRDKKPSEELLKWSFDQGMPLAVYVKTAEGLRFADYFNLPGPMADKEDILKIDLTGVPSGPVTVKLVSGILFWDLDYAGMDFTSTEKLDKTFISLSEAIDENGTDVIPLLSKSDDKYLVQPLPVNKTDLIFNAPDILPGMERSVFLHSKGHYEILREGKGKPQTAYLKTFLEPGAFSRFSKDYFRELSSKN